MVKVGYERCEWILVVEGEVLGRLIEIFWMNGINGAGLDQCSRSTCETWNYDCETKSSRAVGENWVREFLKL